MSIEYKGLRVQSVTLPWIPVGHPRYVWTSSSDVEATWKKYGWKPLNDKPTDTAPVQARATVRALRQM
jgi:hypothetical protein